MDTSFDNIIDIIGKGLQTLIVASIHTLKKDNKKCNADEVFELEPKSAEKKYKAN